MARVMALIPALLLLSAGLLALQPAILPVPPQARPAMPADLATLVTGHPRVVLTNAGVTAARERLASDSRLRNWRDQLRHEAAAVLDLPPVQRTLVGPRLLAQSREALRRISLLAGLYLLDSDPRWRDRAVAELRAVAAFQDWNPSHFLDVAEMAAAVALGYDWLHADLSADDRALLRRALVRHALEPGLAAIDARAWWAVDGRNNWTQVCLGGLTLAALAVADEEPAMAARVLQAVRGDGLARRMRLYAPDGGDQEGPGYWDYATTYTTLLLSALESALGTDFGLGAAKGFAATGDFRMQAIGPSGLQFNYADARETPGDAPQMFWLAGRFDRPDFAAHERTWLQRSGTRPGIFHLLWAARVPTDEATAPPTARRFQGIDVVYLRGDWRDPMTTWVALKGGKNSASHAHLDLGSFVLDALGERWAVDLGPDDYDLPEYFGRRRWSYYRLRTESHNTLLVNGGNQDPAAHAPVVAFSDDSYRASAIIDLTAAYGGALSRARRGIALVDGRDVLVQDEIDGADTSDVVWQLFTRAAVVVDGTSAVLRQGGKTLTMRVIEPPGALLRTGAAVAPPPQRQQPEVTAIRLLLPSRRPSTRIVVWLSSADRPPPPALPLDAWTGQ
jgi:hypothetical protein